ncbi:MAG: histidinol dehydrogenase [Saprospiraceae bacterium]|nr:histidinol dehydrogenase [Saprospiraceae bacterium]
MMQQIDYPDFMQAVSLLARPTVDTTAQRAKVLAMLDSIKLEGDAAIQRFALQFDGFVPDVLEASSDDFSWAEQQLSEDLKSAIRQAYSNIKRFHAAQQVQEAPVETQPGVLCWRKTVPIEQVGLYIPGGTAPLFSTALMLGVPAQLAGCKEVVLCTPPQSDGKIHPAVLFAAGLCGIRRVFKLGGVQAIGAMAYGTAQVPRVWKIFGPGNLWVTVAKQMVSLDGIAIDMPAGPSEVAVLADAGANPAYVAADLLSQAEHGADSQVLLLSDSADLLQKVTVELADQLEKLPRKSLAAQALAQSKALLVHSMEEAMRWINAYAPEHLIIQTADAIQLAEKVINAGSVFIGPYTPESAGDYASGTNHTLPTGGYARVSGGVALDSFVKKITFQQISDAGLQALGPVVETMARAEGLEAHARAVSIRLAAKF